MKLIIDIDENWQEQIRTMPDSEKADYLYGICRNGSLISEEVFNDFMDWSLRNCCCIERR